MRAATSRRRPFFGDTHLHTSFSMDAGAFGARLGAEDAYRFARGEEVMASSGQRAKLSRPLDFLVVADHSDNMGFFPGSARGQARDARRSDRPALVRHDPGRQGRRRRASRSSSRFSQGTFPKALMSLPGTPRLSLGLAARPSRRPRRPTSPGRFTAFIGYEWTSNTGGNNLHRNVIFRDGGDRASQVEPYTTLKPLGSDDPRDLWKWMAAYEEKTGGEVLAIAHNGNLSATAACSRSSSRSPASRSTASTPRRARSWEPLYEATQIKGDGETHPVPLAERRVRQLRALGQGQPRPERAEEARDARSTSTRARR